MFECWQSQGRDRSTSLVVSWAAAPSASYDWLKTLAATNEMAFADGQSGAESMRANIPDMPLNTPPSGGLLRLRVNRMLAEELARQVVASNEPALH